MSGRRIALLVAGLQLLFAVGACTPTVSLTPVPIETPTQSLSPTSPPPSAPSSNAAGVVVDSSLLAVLPANVDGIAIVESAEGETQSLGDPNLGTVADRIVAGLAIDPVSGEFVYAVVVRLLNGAMTDERFRDWRDSYDEGACSRAGGITGHAEAEIAGRTVYIGSCVGGVRTYHVWLQDPGLLVSASAVGERRLGEHLVEGLRP